MFYTCFILFILYSIIGWLLEVLLSLYEHKRFINRGFLIGPYCPIYGAGSVLLTLLLSNHEDNIIVLFILSMVICAILEYFASYILEKIFKLRWWDYTDMKYNINGRICLETMLVFGFFGVILIKITNPFFLNILNHFNSNTLAIIAIILMSIFIIDIIISSNVVFNLKSITRNTSKDSTEEISKAIRKFIHNNLFMYNRIIKAFPHLTIINKKKKGKKVKKKINNNQNKSKKKKI